MATLCTGSGAPPRGDGSTDCPVSGAAPGLSSFTNPLMLDHPSSPLLASLARMGKRLQVRRCPMVGPLLEAWVCNSRAGAWRWATLQTLTTAEADDWADALGQYRLPRQLPSGEPTP